MSRSETSGAASELVRAGYERLGRRYGEWTDDNDPTFRETYLELLESHLEPGSRVVELGSGNGIPTAQRLTEQHRLVCVDFALAQLELVGTNAPKAKRAVADMSDVAFAPASVDAVVAFYSIIHVPRERHRELFASVARWLRPGGSFVASLGGPREEPGVVDEWIDGVEMYWSFYDADATVGMITEAGLAIERHEVLANFEDGREVKFLWVLARKPG